MKFNLKSNESDNFWAENSKHEPIHISDAISGKKGYFCPRCDAELQAKKGVERIHHYAHDPTDRKIKGKCDYSDETYRHKVAKEILQRILKIKVPSLIKLAPEGVEGIPMVIRAARTIEASSAKIQMSFYEDENGEIKWGGNVCEKFLTFIPDVAFFDVKGDPILLIELVATNKISAEKYHKIACIGIDMVQVYIPPDFNSERIEDNFLHTINTKWIYSIEYERTQYKYTPITTGTRVSCDDEAQAGILDRSETYECKAAKIKALIRRIRNCMESEQFRAAQNELTTETSRAEGNIRKKQDDLRTWQRRIEEEILGELEGEESDLGRAEEEFREYSSGLEGRYLEKRKKLERETGELAIEEAKLEPDCQSEIDRVESEINFHLLEQSRTGSSIERIKAETGKEDDAIQKILDDIREGERRTGALEGEYFFIGEDLRKKFTDEGDKSIGAIEAEDYRQSPRVAERIKEIVELRRLIIDYQNSESEHKRLRRAKEVIGNKSYKNWI